MAKVEGLIIYNLMSYLFSDELLFPHSVYIVDFCYPIYGFKRDKGR